MTARVDAGAFSTHPGSVQVGLRALEHEGAILDPLERRASAARRPALDEGLELPGADEAPER